MNGGPRTVFKYSEVLASDTQDPAFIFIWGLQSVPKDYLGLEAKEAPLLRATPLHRGLRVLGPMDLQEESGRNWTSRQRLDLLPLKDRMMQESSLGSGRQVPSLHVSLSDLGRSGSSKYQPERYCLLHPPPKQRRAEVPLWGSLSAYTSSRFWGLGVGRLPGNQNQPSCFSGFKGHRLDTVILREASQTEEDKHCIILLICGI